MLVSAVQQSESATHTYRGCCCSVTKLCPTLCNPLDCSTPGLPVPQHLPEFTQVRVHCISDAIQQSYPLMPSSAANFSSIRDFSNELAFHIGWPNYWSFSFSISPSNEYSRLISRKIDCFDLLAVQGTLGSLLHHHSLKASVVCCSAFFMVQLLQLYMTTENTITLTIQTFIGRVISLLFNNMSRFVITFLQRSNHLISQLQSPSAVMLEPKKRKSVTTSTFSPSICHEVMGLDAKILFCFVFKYWVLSWLFHYPPSPSSRGSLVSIHSLPLEWYHSHI